MTLTPLSEALRQARQDLARQRPDSAADAALLVRLNRLQEAQQRERQQAQALLPAYAAHSAGPRSTLPRKLAWGGSWFAGALLLAATLLLSFEPPALHPPASASFAQADSGFLPVVSQEEWRRAMAGQAQAPVWLMPAELPRERLALLGLPFDASRADERVRAELMLHASGQLLAVRFVQ
ncbi:MAG: hypothetical protein J0L58_08505 [Burkholderiales bacterium]|nr:hypothetical protein [Burkholderiales bacterium]